MNELTYLCGHCEDELEQIRPCTYKCFDCGVQITDKTEKLCKNCGQEITAEELHNFNTQKILQEDINKKKCPYCLENSIVPLYENLSDQETGHPSDLQ